MSSWFVTGTDTGIGKTRASVALVTALRRQGRQPAAMKPVASGCERIDGEIRNADAIQLIHACQRQLPYQAVNPYAFEPPIAPHLAAREVEVSIDLDRILRARDILMGGTDALVVEGVGGWSVPLGPELEIVDLVRALQTPVILVVGMRLGCLNHALLSARQIQADGVPLVGWIGSVVDPDMARLEANLETLDRLLPAPCLGVFPYDPLPDLDGLVACLRMDSLTG